MTSITQVESEFRCGEPPACAAPGHVIVGSIGGWLEGEFRGIDEAWQQAVCSGLPDLNKSCERGVEKIYAPAEGSDEV